jgi:hypothetical protein
MPLKKAERLFPKGLQVNLTRFLPTHFGEEPQKASSA